MFSAETTHEGDVFVLAGNRCTVEHVCHQNGRTRIVFSFLDNPDYGGILVPLSDTEFSVMLNHRQPPFNSTCEVCGKNRKQYGVLDLEKLDSEDQTAEIVEEV